MAENATVGQRFAQFIAYLGISKNAFAASLDKTATVIQHLVDERNKPGFDLLCKVFEVYPNLSKDWLLQGVGPMVAEQAEETHDSARMEPASAKPAPAREKPPVAAAAAAPLAASIAKPAAEISSPKTPTAPEAEVAAPIAAPVAAAPALPPTPETPTAVASAATPPNPVDPGWQTALYTQQMAHQLAMAEMRNHHLQEQQRLMQQMLDLMRKAI
ncbi:hypothetical protein GCM10011375_32140 [Hymenobacter qilianensis]|uniref:Uncharacterized protein n=2 Tax=Hymenobacter qilianensis TaxID=1385715 RepID=A0ACB5PUY2_9BACT|nr:helix-turn-helix transcriptional regulator [Hymenobacter qilianensis]QNP51498.1 helix-turn-helix transcriptional regulator [Hymenobacter qilianensis]GGF74654.1 hypothetical protein GCM10011375_32140 [Hymenobacter qilianensis]